MGKGFEATAQIASSRENVWACLTNWQRAPEWMRGIDDMRSLDDGQVGKATRLAFRSRGAQRETTIVAWSPPSRLALCSRQGAMTATYEYSCELEAGGTRLTLRARARPGASAGGLQAPWSGF